MKAVLVTEPDFAGRLQDGERILWQGVPDPALFNRPRLIAYSLILLPCLPVILWACAAKAHASLSLLSPLNGLLSLALWPFACWLTAVTLAEQTPWAAYALTDRRVMIRRLQKLTSQQSRPRIDEHLLLSLRPRLSLGAGGTGTITFGFPASQYEQAFRAVPDAAAVFALLTDARAARLPGRSDAPYYLQKSAAPAPPAVTLADYLQGGETLLWQGRPDPAAWWRTQRAAIVTLHLLLPAAIGTYLEATGQWTPRGQILAFPPALALYPLWKAGTMRKIYQTEYALTSRRVLALKGPKRGPRTAEERSLAETAGMRLEKLKNGVGTIVFERLSHWVWHGQGGHKETYEFSFGHIADAEAVFAKIADAREAARTYSTEK